MDNARAFGLPGSFAWAKARMEESYPLRDLTVDEFAEFGRRMACDAEKAKHQLSETRPISANGTDLFMGDSGRIERLADFDADTPCAPVSHAPRVREMEEAERIFRRICEDETGIAVDPELKAKKDAEKALLREQSHAIAAKLEAAGVPAYRSGEWALWTYGVHSGDVEVIPQFRRVAFIPFVGAAIREPFVRDLEFFLHGNPWARFWTLTGGPRVPLRVGDFKKGRPLVRKALQRLHRRISQLNDQPFMQAAGVQLVFRSSELGTVERTREDTLGNLAGQIERDADGTLWFHPHAHCVVVLTRGRLDRADWSAFLEKLRAHWVDWMDDGGVIRSVRECVKYVTKPGEIAHLTPDETAELFHQLRRLKLVQPLGVLAAEIKAREEAERTLMRERTDDGLVWREIPKWNRGTRRSAEKVRSKLPLFDEDEAAEFFEATGQEMPEAYGDTSERALDRGMKLSPADVDACVVVARCAPAASSLCLKEPRVVVMGKRWDVERVKAHPLVQRLRANTLEAWHAGLALIRVHTGTPTVVERQAAFGLLADLPERVAPPGAPVFSSEP